VSPVNSAINKVEDDVEQHPEDLIIRFLLLVSLSVDTGRSRMGSGCVALRPGRKDIMQAALAVGSCELNAEFLFFHSADADGG
jgi:hypothetical protein